MACEVQSTRLTVVQGDTARLKFTITQADCETPEDLAAFDEIVFTIKRSKMDSDVAAIFRGKLTLGDIEITTPPGSDGVLEVTVPPDISKLLRTGRLYYWDIQLVGDELNVYTPLYGTILARGEASLAGG